MEPSQDTLRSMGRHAKPNGSERIVKSHGRPYVWIKIDGVWVQKHRYIMEQKLGRKLSPDEHVHHDNENSLDNTPDNLVLTDAVEHKQHHKPERYQKKPLTSCAREGCKNLIPYSEHKEYCSVKCRFYATHVTRRCRSCGKPFIAYRSSTIRNCDACRGVESNRVDTDAQ